MYIYHLNSFHLGSGCAFFWPAVHSYSINRLGSKTPIKFQLWYLLLSMCSFNVCIFEAGVAYTFLNFVAIFWLWTGSCRQCLMALSIRGIDIHTIDRHAFSRIGHPCPESRWRASTRYLSFPPLYHSSMLVGVASWPRGIHYSHCGCYWDHHGPM